MNTHKSRRTVSRLSWNLLTLVSILVLIVPAFPAVEAATPNPTSVTIAGSLQSELGCAGDWDPACSQTHLAYDANGDVWE
ncbi:hypothetical protein EG832_15595, partial [bacterium]|nr:hypothetical protein [bacterium]